MRNNNNNFTIQVLSEHNWVAESNEYNLAIYLSYSMGLKLLKYVKKFLFYLILCRTMHNAGMYNM